MFNSVSLGPGDAYKANRTWVYNRTGSVVQKGQIVMPDLTQGEAQTDTIAEGDEGDVLANCINCTQTEIDAAFPVWVALDGPIADNNIFQVCLAGRCQVMTVVDDESAGANAVIGFPIGILITDGNRSVQGVATNDLRVYGTFLEASGTTAGAGEGHSTAGTTTADLKNCIWIGGFGALGRTVVDS